MNVVAIIQARLGSERFPGKVLAPLWGSTVLRHVVHRTTQIDGVTDVVVACPWVDLPQISDHLRSDERVTVMAASDLRPEDVLSRYAVVARARCAELIVRVTADCPALHVPLASHVVGVARSGAADLASSAFARDLGWPDGWDVEVFTRDLLVDADCSATDAYDREHVTPWMYRHAVRPVLVRASDVMPGLKFSVDTFDDLARLEAHGVAP